MTSDTEQPHVAGEKKPHVAGEKKPHVAGTAKPHVAGEDRPHVAGAEQSHVAGEPLIGNEALAMERIVFFSDAVMAIAITLLAIDLRVPNNAAADDRAFNQLLVDLIPRYFSFAISFAVIAVYWIAHHRMFRFIVRWDGGLLALNLLFLFFVVQLPLLNSILGSYGNVSAATAIYALGLSLMGFASAGLWAYAVRRHLVVPNLSRAFTRYVSTRALAVAIVFAISIPLAFISPMLAELSWLAVSVALLFLRRAFTAPSMR